MVGKKNNMFKNNKPFPLKKVLVAFSILLIFSAGVSSYARGLLLESLAVFTLPNSEHSEKKPILKKETITVTTGQDGTAESASSSVYITNNKEHDVLVDQSSLTNIESSASSIIYPKVNKKTGELEWTLNKKDISYTGDLDPAEIPVKMDVKYYLDGQRVEGEDLAGKTGNLKMDIKYTSTQTVDVDNRASKIPYVAACVVTLDGTAKNIKVKGGSVVKSKNISIAAGLAFPGWEEVLGRSEVGGMFSNRIVITADVKNMSDAEIISTISPDLLEGVTDSNLDAINADNAMTLMETYTKAAVAAAQNVSKALIVADTKVMPMVKTTTAKISDMSNEIVKSIPNFFISVRDSLGKLQATTNMYFYFTSQLKSVLDGEEAISKTEIFDNSFESYMVALRALDPETDEAAYECILSNIDELYGASVKQLSIDLVELCKHDANYDTVLNRIENDETNYGENCEKVVKLAKVYSEETINLNIEEQYILVKEACDEDIADLTKAAIESGADGKEEISKLLISMTKKGGEYDKAMSDQEKLEKIANLLGPEWLHNAATSPEMEKWMDDQGMDEETKAIYKEYIDKAIKEAGENPSMEDMSKATPKKVTEMFKYINKTFDEKNQKSVTNTAAQIAKGVKAVDNMTGKVGVAVHKISNVGKKISAKLTKAYNGAISKVFKMYNKNIRGLTDDLKKIKKVDDKAGVFSGMTDEMQGSTSYMFYTPVASKKIKVNSEVLNEE